MSPKRKRRKPDTATGTGPDKAPGPARPRPGRTSREPVVVADPPDRRITALWVVLALLWALGTPLALANLLFVFMDLQESLWQAQQDPAAPLPGDQLSSLGSALIWVLVLALAVPLAAAVLAAVLRRKIAFIGFTACFAAAALPLFVLMPPAELWQALSAHFSGP